MMDSEVVTITRAEYSDLCEKARKWDNITDERIVYIAWRTPEQWEQFKNDAEIGAFIREKHSCGALETMDATGAWVLSPDVAIRLAMEPSQ